MRKRAAHAGRVLVADDEPGMRDLPTAYPSEESGATARAPGALGYLGEPSGVLTMMSAVDQAIAGGRLGGRASAT